MYSLSVCIQAAMILFPIIAALITIPYCIIHYHRYGSILFLRACIFYSFILYLLCIYLLVVLPLPSIAEVAALTKPTIQLKPFQFVNDIEMYTAFSVWKPDTYWASFFQGAFLQVFYNILMMLPFGIYLRYYYRRNLFECVLLSFALSLFFELTQLSGLYGLYPRPYRLFDVDDLMLNTLGGLVGFLMEPLFVFFLPSKEKLNEISYEKGKKVTLLRRFIGAAIDWTLIGCVLWILRLIDQRISLFDVFTVSSIPGAALYFMIILLYFVVLCYVMHGTTLGKRAVKIQITGKNGKKIKMQQLFVRYFLLYGLLVPALSYELQLLHFIISDQSTKADEMIGIILCSMVFIVLIAYGVSIVIAIFTSGKLFLYENASNTAEISAISRPED